MNNCFGFRISDFGFFLAAFLLLLVLPARTLGEDPPSGVRITFLPPPMEGTLSLGVYDARGKLVRVLAQEATEKNFTVGLNGLITQWDGRDDGGRLLPAGRYDVRGYCVGAVEVEGVALHGNDWITGDDALRPAQITGLRVRAADEIAVELRMRDGTVSDFAIRFPTSPAEPGAEESVPKLVAGRVEWKVDGEVRRFPLAEGESVLDQALGGADRVWAIVQTAGGTEVRASTLHGEFLRRLSYAPGEPQPRRILAARGTFAERWSEQIVLLEENATVQRVRTLALPLKSAPDAAPLWETVLEKSLWRAGTFDAVKELLRRPDGKPFTPEKEFVVRLINNPLLLGEATTAHVNIGFHERGSFLQTTDGLPLRRITETPHLRWAVVGREGSGKLLTILQSDGAVVEEFKVRKLANMMAFDAGDLEWTGGK